MSEQYVHRTCPCYKWDVEEIQTWLEDMAAKGLHLEPDGGLFGIFSFLNGEPKQVRYRLTPVKEKRGFFADNDVTTVSTFPNAVAFAREYQLTFYVSEELAIAFFVFFFDFAYHVKEGSDFSEAFFASFLCKTSIHVGPLVVFTLSCVKKIFGSSRNCVTMKKFEPNFSVLFFVVSSFFKDFSDLFVAIFASLRSIISVFVASH